MTTLFRTWRRVVLPALLLAAGAAAAQVAPPLPLSADPARAVYAPSAAMRQVQRRGTTALSLPFFDDFTTPIEGAPRVQNWVPSGGALVNNRFAIQPPSRGTAILDGLRADGRSYSNVVNSFYGTIDSLTSQPINLSGLTPNDNVYLSFAWQAGSVVGTPHLDGNITPVSLELFAKTDAGVWESVWVYRSQRRLTGFRQQVISLNQAKYLHGTFQFMFVANGNTSDNSDTWNVDYVLLNRGRTRGLADTTFVDFATSAGLKNGKASGGLRSPLRRFTAMPVWQFNAAPTSELSARLGVNVSNLNAGLLPTPIRVLGTVRELPAGPAGVWHDTTYALTVNPRLTGISGKATRAPIATTANAKVLRYTLALTTQETNRLTQPNDTIFRDVVLNNYYAYDDGTAESITQLLAYPNGQQAAYAYRFDLNQPDYVRGLRLYPVFTAADNAPRNLTISVWDDDAGHPAATARAAKTVSIPNPLPAGWEYIELTFDQPVRVTGSFYVGFTQPSQGRNLHYGLDLNGTFPARHLWARNNAGVWDTTNSGGALMMRPVMTNNVATAAAAAREAATFSLYPNPSHGTVTVAGPAFARAAVLDAVGRTVWEQPAAEAGKPTLQLPSLPPGVYLVRLTLPDGQRVGHRLLLE